MPTKINFDAQQTNDIVNLYQSGTSCKQIGKQFDCSKQTINALLRQNNIAFRDASHANRVYQVNENVFETIDTDEKAYWLGMLTGDGCINNNGSVQLSLEQNDRDIVYRFRNFMQSEHPIYMIDNGPKKDGTHSISCTISITNQKLVSDLKKYGFTNDKTHYMPFPDISDGLLPNYMLGLVDSDGCFCLKTHYKKKDIKLLCFSFIGPTKFAETFRQKLIDKCSVSKTKLGTQKNTDFIRVVEYGGYKHIYKIVRFLYNDAPIWMARKKNIAINYLLTRYPDDRWLIDQSNYAPSPGVLQPLNYRIYTSRSHPEHAEANRVRTN